MRHLPMEAAFVLIGFPVIALALPQNPRPDDTVPPDLLTLKPPAEISEVPAVDQSSFMSDERLIQDLHAFNSAEIRKATLAESMARSDKVRALAKHLLEDHQKAEALVGQQAERLGLVLPAALPAEKQLEVDQLAASDGSFDQRYLASIAIQNGVAILHLDLAEKTDRDVRRLSDTLLPTLKRHADEVRRLQDTLASAK
jgi:putative membrane protein